MNSFTKIWIQIYRKVIIVRIKRGRIKDRKKLALFLYVNHRIRYFIFFYWLKAYILPRLQINIQCSETGMFIPDSGIFPSRIPNLESRIQKRRGKNWSEIPQLNKPIQKVDININKIYNYLIFWTGTEKVSSQWTKNFSTGTAFLTQNF